MLAKAFDGLYPRNELLFLTIKNNVVIGCQGEKSLLCKDIILGDNVVDSVPALYGLCILEDHESQLDLVSCNEHKIVDIKYRVQDNVLYACLKNAVQKKNTIIDKQQMRNDLHILTESLYKKNAYINKIYQLQSEFISGVSHEFRTPIASVMGNLDLLKRWSMKLPEHEALVVQPMVNSANSNANYLLSLVNNILDFASSTLDQTVIHASTINTAEVLEEIGEMFAYQADTKHLNLIFEISPDAPKKIVLDVTRLKQILVNLISNALKYTEKGTINVALKQEGDTVVFSVKDTGLGIAEDKQKEIFEPFVREQRNQHKALGAGLGLAITKLLVELMDGRIELISEEGKGSTFSVIFPLQTDHPKEVNLRSETEFMRIFSSKHILVTEDNDDIADLLITILSIYNARVSRAYNGKEATEKVELAVFDVVIMDVNMPIMDGLAAVKIIKSSQPRLPVLGLSASIKLGDDLSKWANNFDDLCPKPFEINELLNKVADLLE